MKVAAGMEYEQRGSGTAVVLVHAGCSAHGSPRCSPARRWTGFRVVRPIRPGTGTSRGRRTTTGWPITPTGAPPWCVSWASRGPAGWGTPQAAASCCNSLWTTPTWSRASSCSKSARPSGPIQVANGPRYIGPALAAFSSGTSPAPSTRSWQASAVPGTARLSRPGWVSPGLPRRSASRSSSWPTSCRPSGSGSSGRRRRPPSGHHTHCARLPARCSMTRTASARCSIHAASAAPTMPALLIPCAMVIGVRGEMKCSHFSGFFVMPPLMMINPGRDEALQGLEIPVGARAPLGPGQAFAYPRGRRGADLGVGSVDLDVAEFGVRYELAVVDHGGPDAGAERDQEDDTSAALSGPVVRLGQTCGVCVVEEGRRPGQPASDELSQRGADPAPVEVGCALRDSVEHHTGVGDAHGAAEVEVLRHGGDDVGHVTRGRGPRRVQPEAPSDQDAGADVDQAALGSGPSDVDTEGETVFLAHGCLRIRETRCDRRAAPGHSSRQGLPECGRSSPETAGPGASNVVMDSSGIDVSHAPVLEEDQEQHQHHGRDDGRDEPDPGPVVTVGGREAVDDGACHERADQDAHAVRGQGDHSLRRAAEPCAGELVGVDLSGDEEEVVADSVQDDARAGASRTGSRRRRRRRRRSATPRPPCRSPA